jgi:hypothetical protein
MSLATSGPISIGGTDPARSINAQFGRASNAQTSMSQLYRGGGIVPNASQNNNVPTSGPISLSNFYGAVNRIAQTITIASNQTDYVANTAKVTGYQAGLMDVTFVINGGVYCSPSATGTPGFDVDTSWTTGDTVTVVNNGFIVGRGGNGGAGVSIVGIRSFSGGSAGSAGGLAFRAQRGVSVNNAGTIGGGGGGGGGGGALSGATNEELPQLVNVSGSGGGGGRGVSSGGAGGTVYTGGAASTGGAGTLTAAGAGGNTGFAGGAGGGLGATGGTGQSGSGGSDMSAAPGLPGGSAGAAVSGNANITWVATGTRLGAIT